ncbi:MAG: Spy/CpxP family protein refolding chaperone [Candidatus Omnitrophica bacterium]|nr:Spy/CpxP family protein refolding chaperone [Candidatus Omnitrophota bacterium]
MKKTKLVIIGLAVFFLTGSSGYAQMQYQDKPSAGRLKEGIYKELNLTPEQQKKLEANRKAQREKTSQLRTAMREKEKILQQALKDPVVTKVKVEPLVNEIKSLQAQLIDQRVSSIFAVREILTPEQLAKFNQLMEKRKEGRKGRLQEWQKRRKGMEYDQG